MIIDIFCHFYTKGYLEELAKTHPVIKPVSSDDGRIYLRNERTGITGGFVKKDSAFDSVERRLALMDKYGIDIQALTIGYPGVDPMEEGVDANVSVKLAKASNDSMAKVVEKNPDRFVGIAEAPILSMDDAVEEVDRAVRDLGLRGVQLYTTIVGRTLDDPAFTPFYEKVAKLDIPILIHPASPLRRNFRSYEQDYELWMLFSWPFETSLAISRIVFSGLLNKYPTLKFVTHHAGAMIPFFAQRIAGVYAQKRKGGVQEASKLPKPPLDYFKMMYHDTAVNGHAPAIRCAYEVFGADHLVFGTDFPYGPEDGELWMCTTPQSIIDARISEDEREKIFWKNTKHLLRIK